MTFEPDEMGDAVPTVFVSVPVFNDDINEATEVFVSVVREIDSPREGVVTTDRSSTLLSIEDNDGMHENTQ